MTGSEPESVDGGPRLTLYSSLGYEDPSSEPNASHAKWRWSCAVVSSWAEKRDCIGGGCLVQNGGVMTTSNPISRRFFLWLTGSSALAPGFLAEALGRDHESPIRLKGPGSRYVPKVRAAFVRRKGDYGMLWPGAIYDGEQARRQYTQQLRAAEKELGFPIDLREEPVYSLPEAEAWLAEAKAAQVDGVLLLLLDRQQHAWPTAAKAVESGLRTVIFAPVGAAFTTNTESLAAKTGAMICSTSDFREAVFGLKMLKAAARIREMRYLVLQGAGRKETQLPFFGTRLRYLPANQFLEEYNALPVSGEVEGMARAYLKSAKRMSGATHQDLVNGIKSFVVARNILEREEGDGITLDCLGALGKTKVSLPCIAWSKMLDQAIPAACEADLGACVTQALVQFLFDRPGFQQDPVAETRRECLIGAHCSCPTRLAGFDRKPEPFYLMHHHGNRDAVPRTVWKIGQKVTIADVLLPAKNAAGGGEPNPAPQLVIGTGTVVENVGVPPAGGCVVSVMLKLDTKPDLLAYPGFHQLFFYGDYKKELLAYCQLHGLKPWLA